MKLKALSVISLTFICAGAALAQADTASIEAPGGTPNAQVQGPDYTVRVPLTSNTAQAREAALTAALAEVFERASGGARIPANNRNRARNWVQNFSLENGAEGMVLRASFDPRAIDEAVTQAGFALWGTQTLGSELIEIQLGNVNNPERYAQLMAQLANDRRVERVEIQSLNGTELNLRLLAAGGHATVIELLGHSDLMLNSRNPFAQTPQRQYP